MKFIVSVLLVMLLSFVASLYLPWWIIAVVAFAVGAFILQKPYLAFTAGFIALLLLWGGLAWFISSANNHILAHKISILVVQNDSPFTLIFITALAGALVAGAASLTGSLMRRLF
ncbi:MAG: hypothetical protein KF862_26875 [Chitinophagaceae bacterium]|nr:hypothetical protein [Chitinophagaceae bacterium]